MQTLNIEPNNNNEREKKVNIKNDKFISYPLLNSNLIFFCSEFVSLCVCKNVQTIGRDRMYSTHCTSIKITLKIRAVKIFVFVCKVVAQKNAGNIKSVCCKQNMSRERAKRSVFFTGCSLLLSISECNAATRY